MKRMLMVFAAVLWFAAPAAAGDYDIDITLTDDGIFKDFLREAGAAAAYRSLAPAEPLGITGFDVGVGSSFIDISDDEWSQVLADQDPPSYLPVPRLQARKGLPFNIDVGAFYAQVPDSDIRLLGGELQWALLEGSIATPALSLRGSYSKLVGVDELDLQTYGADAVVSKGFAFLTPYVGIGAVRIEGDYAGDDQNIDNVLSEHKMTELRYFAGVQASLALLRLTLDAEMMERPIYSVKLSLGW